MSASTWTKNGVRTPITAGAVCDMSGPRGVSLLHPQPIVGNRLTHVATNFQATSSIGRAVEIAEHGGLISIKAHIYKRAYSYVALDGLDRSYRDYLDRLFSLLADRYGNELWWTSMNEITSHARASLPASRAPARTERGSAGASPSRISNPLRS